MLSFLKESSSASTPRLNCIKFGRPIPLFGGVYILNLNYTAIILKNHNSIQTYQNRHELKQIYQINFIICNLRIQKMDWKNKPNQIYNKVKGQMFAKGVQNFYSLDQFIRQFDPQYTGVLTPHFFNLFSNKVGIFLTTQQIRTITELYATQNKQTINYRAFLEDIKYSISENIANLLNQAFDKLIEKPGQREVTLDRLNSLYNADKHPKSLTKIRSAQQNRQIFIKGMVRKSKNGLILKQAFVDYYAELNFCIPEERQTYLQNILVGTWNLVNPSDYVSPQRLREIELILYEKIREKSNGKTSQWKTAKKALSHFDLNDNGKVEMNQFVNGLDKFGCVFKKNQIKAIFNKYDTDNSGSLDYEEFSKMIMDIDINGLSTKPNLFYETMGKNHFTVTK